MAEERIIITPSKFNSVATIVGVVLVLGVIVVGYFAWKSISEENTRLRNEITAFKHLTETLVRSSNKWATKDDLKTEMKDLLSRKDLKSLENDMESLDARLSAVGRTVGSIKRKVSELEKSDSEGPENPNVEKCDDGRIVDTHGYTKKPQIKELKNSQEAPVAKVQFDAAKKKPWQYDVYRRDHRLVTVVGKKESGQLTFHHKLEYSIPGIDPETLYPIDLVTSDYMQLPLKNSLYWFNPILDLNFFGGWRPYGFADGPGKSSGIISIGVDAGLSLSSYGETRADSWFRLFRIGAGYNAERRAAHFSFAPFAFNLGKPLPLLTNLYLTPQLGIDTAGGLTINLGIGPQF
jgi:hypothetical protein